MSTTRTVISIENQINVNKDLTALCDCGKKLQIQRNVESSPPISDENQWEQFCDRVDAALEGASSAKQISMVCDIIILVLLIGLLVGLILVHVLNIENFSTKKNVRIGLIAASVFVMMGASLMAKSIRAKYNESMEEVARVCREFQNHDHEFNLKPELWPACSPDCNEAYKYSIVITKRSGMP